MRPLELHETLLMPPDDEHQCVICGIEAFGFDDLDRVFGFRRMGDEAGTVRIQSRCHTCRHLDAVECERARDSRARFADMRGGQPGVVYVVAMPERGLVKIGFTAAHPMDRLRSFQTACPDELQLIGFWPSDYYGERSTHHELWDRHVRGEWFAMGLSDAHLLVRERDGIVWEGEA